MPTTSTPAIAMRYRNVAAAADWLCRAFGFEKQTVLTDDDGSPLYIQLTCGRAMLMLAPVRAGPIDQLMKQPDEIGGAETQSGYYVVPDADAHYARAQAAGAGIILNVEDDDFGGRTYTCRDLEGHIWTFGTYDPWQGKFPEAAAPPRASRGGVRRVARALFTLILIVGTGVASWYAGATMRTSGVAATAAGSPAQVYAVSPVALEAAERAALNARKRTADVQAELTRERAAKADVVASKGAFAKRLEEEFRARGVAERAADEARAELEKLRASKVAAAEGSGADALKRAEEQHRARETAEQAAKEARSELEKVRAEKAAAAASSDEVRKLLEEERGAREAAERAIKEARAELQQERDRAGKTAEKGGTDNHRLEAAERAAKEARAELEKARADKAAAEMAKEFALGRAEEEQLARAAAESAAKQAQIALEKANAVAEAGSAQKSGPSAEVLKASAELQRALEQTKKRLGEERRAAEQAMKRVAEEKRAREAAERAAREARESIKEVRAVLAKEQASKAQAWKVVSQLSKQLKIAKGALGESDSAADDNPPPAKKARPRRKKKSDDAEQ